MWSALSEQSLRLDTALELNIIIIKDAGIELTYYQGSRQGILAYRAGTRASPARMKPKKHLLKKIIFSCFMHVSLFKTCRNA
jgi:hypothetical protein